MGGLFVFVLSLLFMIALTAAFNWKGFTKRGKILSRVCVFLWTLYMLAQAAFPTRHFLYPLEENQGQAVLTMLILVFAIVLLFLTTEYLPHIKGEKDTKASEKMIKQALNFCIILMLLLSVFIVLVMRYIAY